MRFPPGGQPRVRHRALRKSQSTTGRHAEENLSARKAGQIAVSSRYAARRVGACRSRSREGPINPVIERPSPLLSTTWEKISDCSQLHWLWKRKPIRDLCGWTTGDDIPAFPSQGRRSPLRRRPRIGPSPPGCGSMRGQRRGGRPPLQSPSGGCARRDDPRKCRMDPFGSSGTFVARPGRYGGVGAPNRRFRWPRCIDVFGPRSFQSRYSLSRSPGWNRCCKHPRCRVEQSAADGNLAGHVAPVRPFGAFCRWCAPCQAGVAPPHVLPMVADAGLVSPPRPWGLWLVSPTPPIRGDSHAQSVPHEVAGGRACRHRDGCPRDADGRLRPDADRLRHRCGPGRPRLPGRHDRGRRHRAD